MRTQHLIRFFTIAFCLIHGSRGQAEPGTLVDTFNEIYDSCLVHLSVDCVQPKAFEWFSKSIQKREIHITDDLTIIKNTTESEASENVASESGREHQFDLIGQVDEFLATHYLRIRNPKAIIGAHVPAFMAKAVNKLIPDALHVPLEENNVNEGRGLVKKVLIPFLVGLKFKTTVLLPLAFALIALKAWKALTLGLLSLVVSAAVVIFKLSKPKVVNYEVVHFPHHHHLDHHLVDHHLDHHHLDNHHFEHLDVHPAPHAHIEHPAGWAPHDIAYSAHLDHHLDHHL